MRAGFTQAFNQDSSLSFHSGSVSRFVRNYVHDLHVSGNFIDFFFFPSLYFCLWLSF